jgi:hypothetical protein
MDQTPPWVLSRALHRTVALRYRTFDDLNLRMHQHLARHSPRPVRDNVNYRNLESRIGPSIIRCRQGLLAGPALGGLF